MGENAKRELPAEDIHERQSFIVWVKEHKKQLLLAGVGVTSLLLTILGLKNKEAIVSLWASMKERIKKGSPYTSKWFEKADLSELREMRKVVQQDYRNPNLDLDYRSDCWELLKKFDDAIGKKQQSDKTLGYPVHREHGWYLPNDD